MPTWPRGQNSAWTPKVVTYGEALPPARPATWGALPPKVSAVPPLPFDAQVDGLVSGEVLLASAPESVVPHSWPQSPVQDDEAGATEPLANPVDEGQFKFRTQEEVVVRPVLGDVPLPAGEVEEAAQASQRAEEGANRVEEYQSEGSVEDWSETAAKARAEVDFLRAELATTKGLHQQMREVLKEETEVVRDEARGREARAQAELQETANAEQGMQSELASRYLADALMASELSEAIAATQRGEMMRETLEKAANDLRSQEAERLAVAQGLEEELRRELATLDEAMQWREAATATEFETWRTTQERAVGSLRYTRNELATLEASRAEAGQAASQGVKQGPVLSVIGEESSVNSTAGAPVDAADGTEGVEGTAAATGGEGGGAQGSGGGQGAGQAGRGAASEARSGQGRVKRRIDGGETRVWADGAKYARLSLWVKAYSINLDWFGDDLSALHDNAVVVRILYDEEQAQHHRTRAFMKRMALYGIQVKKIRNHLFKFDPASGEYREVDESREGERGVYRGHRHGKYTVANVEVGESPEGLTYEYSPESDAVFGSFNTTSRSRTAPGPFPANSSRAPVCCVLLTNPRLDLGWIVVHHLGNYARSHTSGHSHGHQRQLRDVTSSSKLKNQMHLPFWWLHFSIPVAIDPLPARVDTRHLKPGTVILVLRRFNGKNLLEQLQQSGVRHALTQRETVIFVPLSPHLEARVRHLVLGPTCRLLCLILLLRTLASIGRHHLDVCVRLPLDHLSPLLKDFPLHQR